MAKLSVPKIQAEINAAGLGWKAAQNPITRLGPKDQASRLGLAVPPGARERIAKAMAEGARLSAIAAHAGESDWRAKDGENYVTAIKDQGNCGSCVSFATVATIESQARIEYKAPTWNIDLSEAELFFCGGAKCADGWWPPEALAYAEGEGIGEEASMPYADHDLPCKTAANRPDHLIRVGEWQEVAGVEQRKGWLDSNGPMIACLAVYEDFFSYADGIYRHAAGDLVGYHAVSCVGFSDAEHYWLCKNSWTEDWGDKGFFKIAYGEAEIDSSFAMYGVARITGTLVPDDHDEERTAMADYVVVRSQGGADVLFAHVDGEWRHMSLVGGRVSDIGTPAFAATQVEVTYKGEEILALSSWKKL